MTDQLVYIGIGSNLDNPLAQVKCAIKQLATLRQSEVIRCSSLYASKPMGPEDQPDYVNAVVLIKTPLLPLDLLGALQQLETESGRNRAGQRWGPRTLDLDILLFGGKIISSDRLLVPHPGIHERAFVLYPLAEINPELMVPGKGLVATLIELCPLDGLEKITA